MTRSYGAQGMVGRLRRVMVRRPDEAMAAADPVRWHYTAPVDVDAARAAHDVLVAVLRGWDVEVLLHDDPLPEHSDAVFVFDLDENPATRRLLESEGCEVVTFPGAALSFKAEGGPTCLTRPVLRDPE